MLEECARVQGEEAEAMVRAKEVELGRDLLCAVARHIMLQTVDLLWIEHLEAMEYLRSSVNLRAYGQRDPLMEYRKEGLQLFRELEARFNTFVIERVGTLKPEMFQQQQAANIAPAPTAAFVPSTSVATAPASSTKSAADLGRNDPCSCGSGKKYKKCCGA